MSVRKPTDYPLDSVLELYDLLLEGSGIARKGKTLPYTSVNGNMFSFLNKDGLLGLRLPDEKRDLFLRKYKTVLCIEHGKLLTEYVVVPEKLFSNTNELQPWFAASLAYAKSLKPKATKKK